MNAIISPVPGEPFDIGQLDLSAVVMIGPRRFSDPARIAADLAARAAEVASAVLPHGFREGDAWVAPWPLTEGDTTAKPIRIIVEGSNAGHWTDGQSRQRINLLHLMIELDLGAGDARQLADEEWQDAWLEAQQAAMVEAIARGWSDWSIASDEDGPPDGGAPAALSTPAPAAPPLPQQEQHDLDLRQVARIVGQHAAAIVADRIPSGSCEGGVFCALMGEQTLELRLVGSSAGQWQLTPGHESGDILDLLVLLGEVPTREDAAILATGEGWADPLAATAPDAPDHGTPPWQMESIADPSGEAAPCVADRGGPEVHDPALPPAIHPRRRLLSAPQLHELPPFEWLVEGILPRRGLAALSGEPGAGKSFLALDLGARVVTGRDFFGRKVRQGRVLLVAAEGAGGLRKRLDAWERKHGGGRSWATTS